jgi:hypothetical protein
MIRRNVNWMLDKIRAEFLYASLLQATDIDPPPDNDQPGE